MLVKTNGVNVEHIRMLEADHPTVQSYRVDLKASLQKNLRLTLADSTNGIQVAQGTDEEKLKFSDALRAELPADAKIVLLHRDADDASLAQLVDTIKALGFEVDLHPLKQDQPLMFGLSEPSATVDAIGTE